MWYKLIEQRSEWKRRKTMKNKIQKMIIGVLAGILLMVQVPVCAFEEVGGLVVPVRFRYPVHGNDLEVGDGIPLEVVDNVYVGSNLIFKQGGGGVAKVSDIKRAGLLSRGGTVEINSGEITDVYGNKHLISLISSSKGSGNLGPLVLTLLSSGLAVAVVPDLLFNNLESTLFGAGLALAPIHFAMKKGKEAKVSDGKVMFARIISSNDAY